MIGLYVIGSLLIIVFVLCVVLSIIGCRRRSDDAGLAIALALICAILLVAGITEWDTFVMREADNFFKTRDGVYKCENLSEMVCSTKKEVWRQDSLVWVKRLDKIKGK